MRFRPCIDIHNGSVKQIVGGSLSDKDNHAKDNFVSLNDAGFYAQMYKNDGLKGGHIIILNSAQSEYYEKDIEQAKKALEAYPGGMQIGGGVNIDNAERYLNLGASHVIVTSYVFRNGIIDYDRLKNLSYLIGKNRLVLDLSCRFDGYEYYVVTDRWQKMTKEKFDLELIEKLGGYCDEFLVHAVDVEGKSAGIEKRIVEMLGKVEKHAVTYAGGIHSMNDVEFINDRGNSKVDFTIGSALDIFGGNIKYKDVALYNM